LSILLERPTSCAVSFSIDYTNSGHVSKLGVIPLYSKFTFKHPECENMFILGALFWLDPSGSFWYFLCRLAVPLLNIRGEGRRIYRMCKLILCEEE